MKIEKKSEKIERRSFLEYSFELDPSIHENLFSFNVDTVQTKNGTENLNPDTTQSEENEELLEEFREAFEDMIESESDSIHEEKQQEAERDLLLELDGMVIDDTRSRVGRNFYDLFYQYWQAPENASNFTIRISERPTPTLGSIVTVKVNDETTFQYRLQPRFSIIEEAAQYAVRVTREYLETSQREYKIY
ncbi:curli production assembly/transport protein CsgE [Rhodohalobacter sp. WB101]|uniref:Curli production assembly/transport component CsgE n=2 Tax=Rhodohalobacter sulfatireducens TaxID=2911366 RepID=A0ABS9KJA4_9BACT|nr:curli production assembly/transport protein CsgE [Rhodohalobacter sulfatireducens]